MMSRFSNHSDQDHGGADYEVFLSFSGEDTHLVFTDHLCRQLVDAGIRVFRDDDELRVGEVIGPELLKAIKGSKISIPVISPSYASSKWCLRELVQILECRKTGQAVLPIFYRVNPSNVGNQTGDFGNSFDLCKKRHGHDGKVVQKWKEALVEVATLKGWESSKTANGHEGDLVKMVVRKVRDILMKEEIIRIVAKPSNAVQVIGIHGMGGIDKTTLPKVISNEEEEIRYSRQQIDDLLPKLSSSTERLHISKCQALRTLPSLSNLKHLSHIELKECTELKEINEGIEELTSLEELIIDGCSSLEKIGDLSRLTELKKLELRSCDKLSIEGIEELTSLEILIIDGCSSLEKISDLSCLTELKKLELRSCDRLSIEGIEELTSLEELIIDGCSFLQKIIDLSRLTELKKLELQSCDKLSIEGIEELTSLEELIIDGCSFLEKIGDLFRLTELKKLKLRSCDKLSIAGIEELTSLEILIIDGCPSIKKVGNLSHLKQLKQMELQDSLKQLQHNSR